MDFQLLSFTIEAQSFCVGSGGFLGWSLMERVLNCGECLGFCSTSMFDEYLDVENLSVFSIVID